MTTYKAIPGLIFLVVSGIASASAQMGGNSGTGEATTSTASGIMSKEPQVIPFPKLPVKKAANGSESSLSVISTLNTGETVSLHASMQPAGAPPVALHAIQHSELIVIREGTVTYEHDGKSETAGPGDVIYVPFGTNHRVKTLAAFPQSTLSSRLAAIQKNDWRSA